MASLTATKTKRVLLRAECVRPPADIREKTKLRRAWLADAVARINALPNREAKIVGTGSYQSVSVYEVTEVVGRVRYRGTCQVCGGQQVVEELGLDHPRLVLHGYKRPGDGYTVGRCPGVGEPPLERSQRLCEQLYLSAKVALVNAQERLDAAKKEEDAAREAVYRSVAEGKDGARAPQPPSEPRYRFPKSGRAARVEWHKARAQWAKQYPMAARYADAKQEATFAHAAEYGARLTRDHFQYLLDLKLLGKPFTVEVV